MTSGVRLTKRAVRQSKEAQSKQINIDKADAEFVDGVSTAIGNFDSRVAESLIIKPSVIRNLIRQTNGHNIRCLFALHAILVALIDIECPEDILNKMSDADIKLLQECINIAKTYKKPDQSMIDKFLSLRQAKQCAPSSHEALMNDAYMKSTRVMSCVAAVWNDAVEQLKVWEYSVETFVRQSPAQEICADSNVEEEWITIEEVAKIFGYKNKYKVSGNRNRLAKKNPKYAQIMNEWFRGGRGTARMLFMTKHIDELKDLFDSELRKHKKKTVKKHIIKADGKKYWTMKELAEKLGLSGERMMRVVRKRVQDQNPEILKKINSWFVRANGVRSASKLLFVAKYFDEYKILVETKKQKVIDASQAFVGDQPRNLVDVKALEKMLTTWKDLLVRAKQEKHDCEKRYKDAAAQLIDAEPGLREKLLGRVQDINYESGFIMEKVDVLESRIAEAKRLLESKKTLEENLQQLNAQISEFIAENSK